MTLKLYSGPLGRLARKSAQAGQANTAAQNRLNRRNQAKQAQAQKRQALISATRVFSGVDGAPRIVAIVPLTPDVKARDVAQSLEGVLGTSTEQPPETGLWKLRCVCEVAFGVGSFADECS